MRTHLRLAAVFVAALTCAGAAGAQVYRWTDENGRLHFTSDLNQVPLRYRDQAATPGESKATFNEHEASSRPRPSAAAAPPAAAEPASPAPARGPVTRIRTDAPEPSKPRMAEFEQQEKAEAEASAPKPSGPQKYIRDCTYSNGGRCKSWVNPEWKDWNEQRKAAEAAEGAEE
jgi:hypothetical protein